MLLSKAIEDLPLYQYLAICNNDMIYLVIAIPTIRKAGRMSQQLNLSIPGGLTGALIGLTAELALEEITGMEGNVITLQEIFSFKQQRIDAEGNVKGVFRFHGVRPKFIERFKISGIKAQAEIFDPSKVVQV